MTFLPFKCQPGFFTVATVIYQNIQNYQFDVTAQIRYFPNFIFYCWESEGSHLSLLDQDLVIVFSQNSIRNGQGEKWKDEKPSYNNWQAETVYILIDQHGLFDKANSRLVTFETNSKLQEPNLNGKSVFGQGITRMIVRRITA